MAEDAGSQTHVWTYWEGESVPSLVQKCQASWRRHLPEESYAIHFLTPESEELASLSFPSTFDEIQPAQRADLIRLRLLEKYGGLWMDASVYLTEPLAWMAKNVVFFFQIPGQDYPESWFIYSPDPNLAMGSWADAMEAAFASETHPSHGAANTGNDAYFVIYDCWCYLQQTSDTFAGDTADWHIEEQSLFFNPFVPLDSQQRLVKFTKKARSLYQHFAFPIPYVVLASVVLLIVAIVVMCRRKS